MAVDEKQIFAKNDDKCKEDDIVQKYFIIDRSELCFSFYSVSGDRLDINRFLNRK